MNMATRQTDKQKEIEKKELHKITEFACRTSDLSFFYFFLIYIIIILFLQW